MTRWMGPAPDPKGPSGAAGVFRSWRGAGRGSLGAGTGWMVRGHARKADTHGPYTSDHGNSPDPETRTRKPPKAHISPTNLIKLAVEDPGRTELSSQP